MVLQTQFLLQYTKLEITSNSIQMLHLCRKKH